VADWSGCGAGWARTRRIGRDGMQASMLCVSGAGGGSSVRTDAASIAVMDAGHASGAGRALGMGLGVRRKHCTDGRRVQTFRR